MRPTLNSNGSSISTDHGSIPWDGANNRPLDSDGEAERIWEQLKAEHKITQPDPYVAPATTAQIIDGVTFLQRLAPQEYQAIVVAARDNPQLGLWIEMLRMRGEIDVTGKTALEAKAGVVAMKLLTQERADQIFAAT